MIELKSMNCLSGYQNIVNLLTRGASDNGNRENGNDGFYFTVNKKETNPLIDAIDSGNSKFKLYVFDVEQMLEILS